MKLRNLLAPAALALLAACAADPIGAAPASSFDSPRAGASADDSGQLGSGNATDSGQLGSGNLTEADAAMPQIGSGAAHDAGPHISGGGVASADASQIGPHIGSGGLAPEDSAASLTAGPAFGSGVGFVQPPADAPSDSIGIGG